MNDSTGYEVSVLIPSLTGPFILLPQVLVICLTEDRMMISEAVILVHILLF